MKSQVEAWGGGKLRLGDHINIYQSVSPNPEVEIRIATVRCHSTLTKLSSTRITGFEAYGGSWILVIVFFVFYGSFRKWGTLL